MTRPAGADARQGEVPPNQTARFRHLRHLLPILRAHGRKLAGAAAVGALIQGLTVLAPYLSRLLIDRAYPARDLQLTDLFVAATAAVTVSTLLLQSAQTLSGRLLQARLSIDVAALLYEHILRQPIDYFHAHRVGEINSRLHTIRASIAAVLNGWHIILRNEGFLLLVPPLLFLLDWRLAMVATCTLPPIAYLTYRQSSVAFHELQRHMARIAELDGFQAESFARVHTLKALSRESYCADRFRTLAAEAVARQQARQRTAARYSIATSLLRAASLCACTWIGWRMVMSGSMSLGEFIAFSAYLTFLYNPLRDVVEAVSAAQEAALALNLACECLAQPTEAERWQRAAPAAGPAALRGELALHDVTFGYPEARPVFDRLSLTFPAATTTLIMGPSGAGKTTLLQMLVGFKTPACGRITIGGRDLRSLPLETLRRGIAVVWQEDSLVSATLWENLTLGAVVARAKVDRVVELCALGRILAEAPGGYDTRVGEGGVRLSAGERQRVAIARALIRDTPIILCDEATANVDVDTEHGMLRGIRDAYRDRLFVLVTHRPHTAALADRVLWCADGTVRDVGAAAATAGGRQPDVTFHHFSR